MRIILYTWFGSYTDDDIERNLIAMGHDCFRIRNENFQYSDRYEDEAFCEEFKLTLKKVQCDCVFTTNFHPLISKTCYEKGIPYVAWSYDSPPDIPDTRYMDFPTNHLFFFSRDDVNDLRSQGMDTVYYMPLAVDTAKWESIKIPEQQYRKYSAEISLVGSLYSSTLPALMKMMSDEQRVFFETLSDLQLNNYDKYLLKEFITPGVAGEVCKVLAEKKSDNVQPTAKQLIYATATYVTHLDRLLLLKVLSERFDTHLYTDELPEGTADILSSVRLHGQVDYDKEMPVVFKSSAINLCPIFRGNVSGIPLRILDVMGCASFVLAPFRPEMDEYFKNGVEIVTYHSAGEAIEKADYYIKHPGERKKVALAGYERVKNSFSYKKQLGEILRSLK